MKNRRDIRDFIISLEDNYPVNEWKYGSLHAWPFIRKQIYFNLVYSIENSLAKTNIVSSPVKPKSLLVKVLSGLSLRFKALVWTSKQFFSPYQKKLPQRDYLFASIDLQWTNLDGKMTNKFIDPIIEEMGILQQASVIQYGSKKVQNLLNSDITFNLSEDLLWFTSSQLFFNRTKQIEICWKDYESFLNRINSEPLMKNKISMYSIDYWRRYFKGFDLRVKFYEKIIRQVDPKKVITLCYIHSESSALICAANNFNVSTVEVQHGPQTSVDAVYAYWTKIPSEGYNMIPREYWCWDENNLSTFAPLISTNAKYSGKVIGNPWINYCKNRMNTVGKKDYILYSLQPEPVQENELFNEVLMKFISEQPYQWIFRLHPMQGDKIKDYESILETHQILNKVTLSASGDEPLPFQIQNAKIHVTNYSGTSTEAALLDVHTIIIHPLGESVLNGLISEGKASYIPLDNEFEYQFIKILNKIID